MADVTEHPARTDPGGAGDGVSDGRNSAPGAVRVSLVGSKLDAAAARIVVGPGPNRGHATVDGRPLAAALQWLDGRHARLQTQRAGAPAAILLLPPSSPAPAAARSGVIRREVVVDGWRFEVEIEPETRAALRERASRAAAAHVHDGPFEVRAVIPGRIVSVEVVPGDSVAAGQRVMIIEAMKMQNELRVPRSGTVGRIAVGAGQTIEVGDLLLVLA